ncbi:hypothetical protein FJTKL_12266 [Diaporthe vaccinii]|uniref:Uncharacterized protein n=1 Tax=Diaporthe vaccinii TaxID=105482 RepID=A0ABR4EED6_9PEZI
MILPHAHSKDIHVTIVLSQNTLRDQASMEIVGVCLGLPMPRLSAASYGAGSRPNFPAVINGCLVLSPHPILRVTDCLTMHAAIRSCEKNDKTLDRAVWTFVLDLTCNAVRTLDKCMRPKCWGGGMQIETTSQLQ